MQFRNSGQQNLNMNRVTGDYEIRTFTVIKGIAHQLKHILKIIEEAQCVHMSKEHQNQV